MINELCFWIPFSCACLTIKNKRFVMQWIFFVLLCFETIVLKNYSLEQFTLFSYLIDSFDRLYTWIFFYFMHLTSWWIFSYQNIVSFKFMWKLTWYFISRAFLDLEKNMWTHKLCNLACNLAIANWFKMHMV